MDWVIFGEDNMKVLIVVPAYNEAENIVKTIEDIKQHTSSDYIIIDDCSKDNTYQICKENHFNVLHLPINYGLTSGVQIGFKYASEGYTKINLIWENCPKDEELDDFAEEYIKKWKETHT